MDPVGLEKFVSTLQLTYVPELQQFRVGALTNNKTKSVTALITFLQKHFELPIPAISRIIMLVIANHSAPDDRKKRK